MKFLFAFLMFVLVLPVQAQRSCGTMELYATSVQNTPQLEQNRLLIESQIRDWITLHGQDGSRAVITIPVVVHVVYNASGENISDSQVQSQIDVLNEDYARLNADASQTPAAFQGVAANCEIQFCLAQRDPNNQPTNGITRTPTTAVTFPLGGAVKHAATGGKNAWPNDKYLNIWVCNLANPVIGFATLPATSSPDEDGVVIVYKHFGRTGNVQGPYNKGRTATHEVGHWLNLLHTWGDDENSSDPCAGTDQVSDTPNQSGPNFGCPALTTNSCGNGGDMFMNFMDYTDDNCMNIFTAGQKNRMLATLNGIRSSIPFSLGCQTPPIVQECDTLNNIVGGDGLVYYLSNEIVPTDTGFFTGTNSRGDLAFADKHFVAEPSTVDAIRFDFAYAFAASGSSSLRVAVWDDSGVSPLGSPGVLIGEAQISYDQIINNVDNFSFTDVIIPGSPIVTGNFYVGFFTSDIPEDTMAVYSNQIDSVNVNSAWLKNDSEQWFEFSAAETFESPISLAIRPIVCGTVQIEEVQNQPLLVYPNPTQGIFQVVFPDKNASHSWQVFSMDGRLIRSGSVSTNSLQLDISDAPAGIYLIRDFDGTQVKTMRFSIIH